MQDNIGEGKKRGKERDKRGGIGERRDDKGDLIKLGQNVIWQ